MLLSMTHTHTNLAPAMTQERTSREIRILFLLLGERKGNKQTIMVDYKTAIKRMEINRQHAGTLTEINSQKCLNLFPLRPKNKSRIEKASLPFPSPCHRLRKKRYYGRKRLMPTLRMC